MANTTSGSSSKLNPSFRYDLETTAIQEGGNRYVDVSDPTGNAFRFYEVEYAVACGMDGSRSVDEIVRWAKSELDLQTDESEIQMIVEKLSELKYLEFAEAISAPVGTTNTSTTNTQKDLNKITIAEAPVARELGLAKTKENIKKTSEEEVSLVVEEANYAGDLSTPVLGEAGESTPVDSKVPVESVELGLSGGSKKVITARPAVSNAVDMELGAPGGETPSNEKGRLSTEDLFELGDSGNQEEAARFAVELSTLSKDADTYENLTPDSMDEKEKQSFDFLGSSSDSDVISSDTKESLDPLHDVEIATIVDDDESAAIELAVPDLEIEENENELSTDLSSSFGLDARKVKDAVRASQVMAVAELPDDLKESARDITAKKVGAVASLKKKAVDSGSKKVVTVSSLKKKAVVSASSKKIEAVASLKKLAKPAGKKSESVSSDFSSFESERTETGTKAIILAESPEKLARKRVVAAKAEEIATKDKAPSIVVRSASLLLWLLLLAAVIFGAYYFYTNYVKEDSGSQESTKLSKVKPAQELVVAPIAAPKSSWTIIAGVSTDIKASQSGVIAWMAEPGVSVKAGNELVRLKGYGRVLKSKERNQKSLGQYQSQLDVAKGKGKASRITLMEKNVARKKADIAKDDAKMRKYIILAESTGTAKMALKIRARIKEGDVLGTIQGESEAKVRFELLSESKAQVDDLMEVQVLQEAGKLKVNCKVTEIQGKALSLSCPMSDEILNETPVELVL